MEVITRADDDDEEMKRLEKLERVREYKRRYAAKRRAENPEAARAEIRDYMRKTKASLNYYHRNKETVLVKQRDYQERRKAEKLVAMEVIERLQQQYNL